MSDIDFKLNNHMLNEFVNEPSLEHIMVDFLKKELYDTDFYYRLQEIKACELGYWE